MKLSTKILYNLCKNTLILELIEITYYEKTVIYILCNAAKRYQ